MFVFLYQRKALGEGTVIKVVKQAVIHCTCSSWHANRVVEALEPQAVPFLLASLLKTFAYIRLKVRHCARLQTRSKRKNMYYYFKCIDFYVTFPYGLFYSCNSTDLSICLYYDRLGNTKLLAHFFVPFVCKRSTVCVQNIKVKNDMYIE